jgi:crotonobetainyl-CoA:carnitine CoA-transferase CaiB-like acyl-CoA transferase
VNEHASNELAGEGKAPGPRLLKTRDGKFMTTSSDAWNPGVFQLFCKAMDRPDLLTDPRYATIRSRGVKENMQSLDAMVAAWTSGFDGRVIEKLLQDAGVPASRVFTVKDIFEDPHYAARDMIARVPHPVLGETRQTGVVPKLSATPGRIRHSGPELGADTESILRDELALTPEVVAALVEAGVVRTTSLVENL